MTNLPESHAVVQLAESLQLPEDLRQQLTQLLKDFPQSSVALGQLLSHFSRVAPSLSPMEDNGSNVIGKKRKLIAGSDEQSSAPDDSQPLFAVRDLTFQAPRKKCDLILSATSLRLLQPVSSGANNSHATSSVELFIPFKDIRKVICLPTPNKPKKHFSLVLLVDCSPEPAILLQFADDKPVITVETLMADQKKFTPPASGSNRETLLALLTPLIGAPVEPNESIFLSRYPAAVQKSRDIKQYHVDCHVKAKDGQLFFLGDCLLFGFRKPIVFIEHKDILSMEVQSITSRTFDLVVKYSCGADSKTATIEFGMLDPCEFDPIMAYVNRYKLNGPTVPAAGDYALDDGISSERSSDSTTDRVANPLMFLHPNNPIPDGSEDESTDEDYQESGSSSDEDYSSSSDGGSGGESSDFDDEEDETGDEEGDDVTMSSGDNDN